MGPHVGPLAVRRSIWIDAKPERVWEGFESFEAMKAWFGTGHTLVSYEPRVGAWVETDASAVQGEELRLAGAVTVFDPPHELTFEQDWVGHGWAAPMLITLRLTPVSDGTLVELVPPRIRGSRSRCGGEAPRLRSRLGRDAAGGIA
jgi:uncharacterized protein YndB with AHSA1/START domain